MSAMTMVATEASKSSNDSVGTESSSDSGVLQWGAVVGSNIGILLLQGLNPPDFKFAAWENL